MRPLNTPTDKELKDIFDSLPSAYPENKEGTIKLINFAIFQMVVDKMMTIAYTQGGLQTANDLGRFIQTAFNVKEETLEETL